MGVSQHGSSPESAQVRTSLDFASKIAEIDVELEIRYVS
jgi:hypothetical protein